jgi:hypothetical protein
VKEAKEGWTFINNMIYRYTDSQYRKELLKDAVQSAYVFLPVWQTVIKPGFSGEIKPVFSGEKMIMKIRSVLKGLQNTFCMLNIGIYILSSFREVISACIYLVDVSSF